MVDADHWRQLATRQAAFNSTTQDIPLASGLRVTDGAILHVEG